MAFKDLSRKILNYFSLSSPAESVDFILSFTTSTLLEVPRRAKHNYCASRWSANLCKSALVAFTRLGTSIPNAV